MWSRLDGETDEELIYRICSLKGSEGLENWQSIANVLNEITGQEYTESKYRKQYQAFQKMLNGNQRLFVNDDSQFAELEVQKRELAKERQKLSDARVDYNRIIREEARKESYLELVQKTICEKIPAIQYERGKVRCNNDSDNDLIQGISSSSCFNWYFPRLVNGVNNITTNSTNDIKITFKYREPRRVIV